MLRVAFASARAPSAPLLAALPPDIQQHMIERRWQPRLAQQRRAEPRCQRARQRVVGLDAMDHLGPAERVEGVVDGGARALGGVAAAPELAREAPADLCSWPAFRHPRPEPTDPA